MVLVEVSETDGVRDGVNFVSATLSGSGIVHRVHRQSRIACDALLDVRARFRRGRVAGVRIVWWRRSAIGL